MTLPVPAPEPLPAPVIDSHCHLDITTEYSGLAPADALAAAGEVGVSGVIQIGVDVASSRNAVALAEQFDNVRAAVAVHPNEAARRGPELEDDLRELEALALNPRVVAIGETGLDHFRTGAEGRSDQEQSFRDHIRLARRTGKTLVIHDRDAHADVLRVLGDESLPDRVVFHCFSGDATMARTCADAGWYLSFPGVLTFKNAQSLRDAAAVVPPERLLVETDAPFLTPTPHRGSPNASYLMPWTVRALAHETGSELAELCDRLRANTVAAFALGADSGLAG